MDIRAPAASLPEATSQSSMSLWEANFLVAQLAGFWGRKADGHPGPDLMGHGLLILAQLVRWERMKKQRPLDRTRSPSRKPGQTHAPHPREPPSAVSSPGFRREG